MSAPDRWFSWLRLLLLLLFLALVGCVVYHIYYRYVWLPAKFEALSREYNQLVDNFNEAVQMTALAYLRFGPKADKMPIDVLRRAVNGLQETTVRPNALDSTPTYLYDDEAGVTRTHRLIVQGMFHPQTNAIYLQGLTLLKVDEDEHEVTGHTYEYETFESINGLEATSHPATWVPEYDNLAESEYEENTTYMVVASASGGFELRKCDCDFTNAALPETMPVRKQFQVQARK